jgi:hypothetical protein
VPGDDNNFSGFRLIQLTHQLDAFAIRETKVSQQHVRTLPPELNTRIPQAVRSRYRKALHACNFLQPVHDICIIVDYQSMCHVIPWTKSINRRSGRFRRNTATLSALSSRSDGND